jgi:hypothetical protein
MHDTLNAQVAAIPIEKQMAVKWPSDLDAADAGKFWGGEVAANAKVRLPCDTLNRFMYGQQLTPGDSEVGIFQIPAVLQSHVLLRPFGDEDFKAHAWRLAFCRMRSSTEASYGTWGERTPSRMAASKAGDSSNS